MPRFEVVKPDMTTDLWGVDRDADYEIGKDGTLRVVEFTPTANGLSSANWVIEYAVDDWADVRVSD